MKNIERNKIDYFITDLLPNELPYVFTLNNFYDFLIEKKNTANLDEIVKRVRKSKNNNDNLFKSSFWKTVPLNFNISKNSQGERKISLINPVSMINIYIFLELYQKDILNELVDKSVFSIRYHTKNNNLFYNNKNGKIVEYYSNDLDRIQNTIKQHNTYFDIKPYRLLTNFTNSNEWYLLNKKFSYYAKIDYKSCFDSIYTHSYKWIINSNLIDSKNASNSELFYLIDKLMQNINGSRSNGIIVGPEFSRMIAELLLQEIDSLVHIELLNLNLVFKEDYHISRYVDDVIIFAKTKDIAFKIMDLYENISEKYSLSINELKRETSETPVIPSEWVNKTRLLMDKYDNCFRKISDLEIEKKYLLKSRGRRISFKRIKDEFNALIKEFPENKHSIVSFCLSTTFNKVKTVKRKKKEITLVNKDNRIDLLELLELNLFIYSTSPNYNNTQKLISIIDHLLYELDLDLNHKMYPKLIKIFDVYSYLFLDYNLNDMVNLFLVYSQYGILLPSNIEIKVFERIISTDNPILLATFIFYCKTHDNNSAHYKFIINKIEEVIASKIQVIIPGEFLKQEEFWYLLIFHESPMIREDLNNEISKILAECYNTIEKNAEKDVAKYANKIVFNFLLEKRDCYFIDWNGKNFSQQISFKTAQLTWFKNSNISQNFLDFTSLE